MEKEKLEMGRSTADRGQHFDHPVIVKIRERAGRLGVKQTALGRHLETTHAKANRWFNGHTIPSREDLIELEDALMFERGELLVPAGYLPGSKASLRRTDDGGIIIEIPAGSIDPRAHSSNMPVIALRLFELADVS